MLCAFPHSVPPHCTLAPASVLRRSVVAVICNTTKIQIGGEAARIEIRVRVAQRLVVRSIQSSAAIRDNEIEVMVTVEVMLVDVLRCAQIEWFEMKSTLS